MFTVSQALCQVLGAGQNYQKKKKLSEDIWWGEMVIFIDLVLMDLKKEVIFPMIVALY